jgi:hypothetical protein
VGFGQLPCAHPEELDDVARHAKRIDKRTAAAVAWERGDELPVHVRDELRTVGERPPTQGGEALQGSGVAAIRRADRDRPALRDRAGDDARGA